MHSEKNHDRIYSNIGKGVIWMKGSYPAQVSAVFDTNGQIHPLWCKFKNEHGEIITISNLEILKENSKVERTHRNYLCRAIVYARPCRFCLSYNMYTNSWSVEVRSSEREYRYLVSHDRKEFM